MISLNRLFKKKEVRLKVNFSRDLTPTSLMELAADKVDIETLLQSKLFQYMLDWIEDEQRIAQERIMDTFDAEDSNGYRIQFRTLRKLSLQLISFYKACEHAEEELVEQKTANSKGE